MKKIFCFLAVASTMLLASCGSDDSSSTTTPPVGGDDNGGGTPTPGVTAIVLSANVENGQVGTTFTFTVKDNLGATVTSSSAITIDGVPNIGNTFTPEEAGTYEVEATKDGLVSNKLNITVTEAPVAGEANMSVIVNGTNHATPNSWLFYLGSEYVDESETVMLNYWVANSYNETQDGEYPTDVYVHFTNEQDANSNTLNFFTTGVYNFSTTMAPNIVNFLEVTVNNTETEVTSMSQDFNLNISALTLDTQNWSYTFAGGYNSGNAIAGQFTGVFGFTNIPAAQQPQARTSSKNFSPKILSKEQIKANALKVMSVRK